MILAGKKIRKILAIGAHADDIEIGCGGTLLRLIEENRPELEVHWVVFSGTPARQKEARKSAEAYLADVESTVSLLDFRDGHFPDQWADIKKQVHAIGERFDPDLIFTHRLEDRHQDHRTLAELTWNAFRRHLILEYEIPKYEGDLGQNNFYGVLSREQVDQKIALLESCFPSQLEKPWFDRELFAGLMRLRGAESLGKQRYAEAFQCRKFAF